MKISYVDVHAHLNEKIFDKDRAQILKECEDKGIFVVNCGGTPEGNRKSISLLKYPNINLNMGIYPFQAIEMDNKKFFDELEFIDKNRDKIVGIGEVGIDFHWIKDKKKQQLEIERFKEIVWFANKRRLPLNVHSRDAEEEVVSILSKTANVPIILHSFGGGLEIAKKAASEGFYISIPPIIEKSKIRQRIASEIPLGNILTETDSPYMGPTKERNDPRNIPLVVKKISELKGIDEEYTRKQILKNAGDVFNLRFN